MNHIFKNLSGGTVQVKTNKLPFLTSLALSVFSRSGDPHHGASADQDGSDAQPLSAQSDHGDGGGGSRPPAAHNQ